MGWQFAFDRSWRAGERNRTGTEHEHLYARRNVQGLNIECHNPLGGEAAAINGNNKPAVRTGSNSYFSLERALIYIRNTPKNPEVNKPAVSGRHVSTLLTPFSHRL
jgi:hypothetical protein